VHFISLSVIWKLICLLLLWQLERFTDRIPLALHKVGCYGMKGSWSLTHRKHHHNYKGKWKCIPVSSCRTDIPVYSTVAFLDGVRQFPVIVVVAPQFTASRKAQRENGVCWALLTEVSRPVHMVSSFILLFGKEQDSSVGRDLRWSFSPTDASHQQR